MSLIVATATLRIGYAPGASWRDVACDEVTTPGRKAPPTAVYLELGSKRVFACSLDWPGWCRAGRDEEAALEALAGAAGRYAVGNIAGYGSC